VTIWAYFGVADSAGVVGGGDESSAVCGWTFSAILVCVFFFGAGVGMIGLVTVVWKSSEFYVVLCKFITMGFIEDDGGFFVFVDITFIKSKFNIEFV